MAIYTGSCSVNAISVASGTKTNFTDTKTPTGAQFSSMMDEVAGGHAGTCSITVPTAGYSGFVRVTSSSEHYLILDDMGKVIFMESGTRLLIPHRGSLSCSLTTAWTPGNVVHVVHQNDTAGAPYIYTMNCLNSVDINLGGSGYSIGEQLYVCDNFGIPGGREVPYEYLAIVTVKTIGGGGSISELEPTMINNCGYLWTGLGNTSTVNCRRVLNPTAPSNATFAIAAVPNHNFQNTASKTIVQISNQALGTWESHNFVQWLMLLVSDNSLSTFIPQSPNVNAWTFTDTPL